MVIGVASILLLSLQGRGRRRFEHAAIALLAVIAVGFVAARYGSVGIAAGGRSHDIDFDTMFTAAAV